MSEEEYTYVDFDTLERFMKDVMMGTGVPEEDAKVVADVLITSDKRGIDSHGVGRLMMYYARIKRGQQLSTTKITVIKDNPGTARWDAGNGMGHVVSKKAMQSAIDKAKKNGIGLVVVGNSNHFGIAGYYALMAADQGCIGICGTNARPSIAPTWSVEPMLGTNPLTIALPTDWKFHWCADHATSITQRGKIETYARIGKEAIPGWVIDENGNAATDAPVILKKMLEFKAALTPLGGIGEDLAGYKGYNYATFVEILSACLTESNYLQACLGIVNGEFVPYNLGHFFFAIDINSMIDLEKFKRITGDLLRQLANAKKAPGADHIYIAGEKEYLAYQERKNKGVPISKETQKQFLQMKQELGLDQYDFNFDVKVEKSATPGW
ncbi:MAG: Ldh family oxidoreductase [Candidatus Lokiarchaeota archaeon]|nr:Ldh family oxidoreductase [Candidatus Lokiarchaeota archaeon]